MMTIRLSILLSIAWLFSACVWMESESPLSSSDSNVKVGDSLPEFSIRMADGTDLSTADLTGRPSLIVFFRTDCPDCQREMPLLNKRYLQYGQDTTFVAIAREQSGEVVSEYWRASGLSIPYSAQSDRAVYSLFAKRGIPRVYIADQSGVVREIND